MNEDSDPDGYSRQLCLQLLSWGKRKIVMKSMRDIANLTTTCSIRNNIITQCNAAAAPAGRTGSADRGRVPGRPGTGSTGYRTPRTHSCRATVSMDTDCKNSDLHTGTSKISSSDVAVDLWKEPP